MRIHWIALFAIIFLTSLAVPMKTVHSLETQATPDDTTSRTPYNTQTTSPVEFISSFGGVQNTVAMDAGYAYMGEGAGLRIVDVRNTSAPVSVAYLPLSDIPSDIQIANGYAYIANKSGLQVIDVRDVTKPMVVSNLRLGTSLNLYVIDNLVYVAGEESGLQIVDVGTPTNPAIIGSYRGGGVLDVQVAGDYAYIAQGFTQGDETSQNTFVTLDVSDPVSPIPRGSVVVERLTYLTVVGSFAYVASGGIPAVRAGHMYTIDISNPDSPTIRDNTSQINPRDIEIVNDRAYIVNELSAVIASDDEIEVVDVSDPTNLKYLGGYETTIARDVQVVDGIAYMVGNGLEMVNIANPANPTQQNYLPLLSDTIRLVEADAGIAYVTNGTDLYLFDIQNIATPVLLGQYSTPTNIQQIVVDNSIIYLVRNYEIHIIDVSNPSNSVLLSQVTVPRIRAMQLRDNKMYVYSDSSRFGQGDLFIFDVSNPTEPQQLKRMSLEDISGIDHMAVIGNRVYLLSSYYNENTPFGELYIVDISNLEKPVLIDSYETDDFFIDMKIIDNQVYVAGQKYLYVFDGDGPIRLISKTALSRDETRVGTGMQIHNDIAYVIVDYLDTDTNIQLFDVSDPAQPTRLGQINTQGDGHDLHVDNGLVYIANGDAGVRIIRVQPEQLPPEIFLPIVQS